MDRFLSNAEHEELSLVLSSSKPVKVLLWGAGENRNLSFYAQGTRLEARIPYPESSDAQDC